MSLARSASPSFVVALIFFTLASVANALYTRRMVSDLAAFRSKTDPLRSVDATNAHARCKGGGMWLADIYCDLEWVRERQGNLGPSRLAPCGMRSESLGIAIEMRLYGDDYVFRHLRVLLHTDDHHTAETCVNLNIQKWVAALETAVILHTGRTFTIAHLPGTLSFPSRSVLETKTLPPSSWK
jgi:hypothetical protein